jgi:ATP-dependent Clp protease, protease subunit
MIYYNIDPSIKVRKTEDLLDNIPVVVLVNEFTEKSAKDFRNDFTKAVNTGQKIIPILIDSYGGQVYSLLSMVATIKSSPVPIATIATGKAMSCGSILFSCGSEGNRFIDSAATIMIHDVSSWSHGKVEEIKSDAKEVERLNQYVYKLMASNVGKSENYFLDLVHDRSHADFYLTPQDCIKHNLANYIRTPSFKVSVKTEIVFG